MDQIADGRFAVRPSAFATGVSESQRLRLATLTRLRWLSVAGQTAACVFVAWGLWWPYPVAFCLALIALSIVLNIGLDLAIPKSRRLSASAAAAVLSFDILQPSLLLFLTGGLHNPFAAFLVVPVIIASATQPPLTTVALGTLAVVSVTILTFWHLPLPWPDGTLLVLPPPYVGGLWFAIMTVLVFSAIYIYRVAAEGRALADALAATELVLQREQHLNALDGLAAAAAHELGSPLATISLVAKEMGRTVPADDPQREDVDLLIQQTERCRDILGRLSSLSSSSEEHMARLPFLALIEEVVAPHRDFGILVDVEVETGRGAEPVVGRNAGVLYGLGNLVENAVDFATNRVVVRVGWSDKELHVTVNDDGPGFSQDALARVGDPYMTYRRQERNGGGGLGLGLFIAKTLLERSGGHFSCANQDGPQTGATVAVSWPVGALAAPQPSLATL
ncbi:ActS/PrrB/RegB family redox-sensitive histidine kinase [Aureimonas psammosilenae]|uniref:ActS/PrrB/RegB family redox-sensitive histidine kinase n=1 Tax=Aureimonas psammosilenae TaxID=2495496 RepID=UPI0012604A4B|nr:ActS/PrrB/RegB family redox-sensitive histidine kinase [Aureimonas psammosilenae]